MALDTQAIPAPVDPWPLYGWMRIIMGCAIVVLTWMFALTTGIALVKAEMPTWGYERINTLALVISYSQLLNVALFIASLVVSARMTYRTMSNVHKLKGADGQSAAAWSVAWYAVPGANLIMPPRAVHQIWTGTFGDGEDAKRRANAIWQWWVCGLISIALHQISLRLIIQSGPIAPSLGDALNPLSYAFAIAGTVLFLGIFRRVARGQNLLIARAATPS
ncbi:MAG: DUF4328 domain-containing protein [Terricaulis sp.]